MSNFGHVLQGSGCSVCTSTSTWAISKVLAHEDAWFHFLFPVWWFTSWLLCCSRAAFGSHSKYHFFFKRMGKKKEKEIPFSFHPLSKHSRACLGESCVFDEYFFSILETLKHPVFARKRIITQPMKCWWAKWAELYLPCGGGSLESQSRWRAVRGGQHLPSAWGMPLLLRSLVFTRAQIILGP